MHIVHVFLISSILRTYTVFHFIDIYLRDRRCSRRSLFVSYAIYYLVSIFLYQYERKLSINVIVNVLLGLAVGFLYRTTMQRRVSASLFTYILSLSSELCSAAALSLVLKLCHLPDVGSEILLSAGIILSVLIFILFARLSESYFGKHRAPEKKLPRSYWLATLLVPGGSMIVIFTFAMAISNPALLVLPLLETCIFLIVMINGLVFYLYACLLQAETVKYENILLSRQNEDFKKQAELIEIFQGALREQKHDMKNHLAVVSSLLSQNCQAKAEQYIEKLTRAVNCTVSSCSSGNMAIDSILNSKLFLAAGQHTDLQFSVHAPEKISCDDMDMTIILGNLLDNALEACSAIPESERRIYVSIDYLHDSLLIQISNTYDPRLLVVCGDKLRSTKPDMEEHGLGIDSVRHTVERYNGELALYQKKDKNGIPLFVAQVLVYPDSEITA